MGHEGVETGKVAEFKVEKGGREDTVYCVLIPSKRKENDTYICSSRL